MTQANTQPPHQSRKKCASCGLVNSFADESCRRCGGPLTEDEPAETKLETTATDGQRTRKRGFLKRLIWVLSATLVILVIWYASLLLSSDGLKPDQKEKVRAAIVQLEQRGFKREAFILKHLAIFRSTDNWWNSYVGHRDAYAATNFPFEVVTLYPEFFEIPVDDVERAAVLLHEAAHLMGSGEEAALNSTWREKRRLGWSAEKYRQTRVWNATEHLTRAQFPFMFQCGSDGQSDCF